MDIYISVFGKRFIAFFPSSLCFILSILCYVSSSNGYIIIFTSTPPCPLRVHGEWDIKYYIKIYNILFSPKLFAHFYPSRTPHICSPQRSTRRAPPFRSHFNIEHRRGTEIKRAAIFQIAFVLIGFRARGTPATAGVGGGVGKGERAAEDGGKLKLLFGCTRRADADGQTDRRTRFRRRRWKKGLQKRKYFHLNHHPHPFGRRFPRRSIEAPIFARGGGGYECVYTGCSLPGILATI